MSVITATWRGLACVMVTAVVAEACRGRVAPQVVQGILADALGAGAQAFDQRTMPSSVLAGVTYHWGVFRNPEVADSRKIAVVGVAPGRPAVLIESPEDWTKLAEAAAFRPSDRASAIAGCADLLRTAGPERDPMLVPRVFEDSTALDGISAFSRDRLHAITLVPPGAEEFSGRWVVTMWAVEAGRAARYRCMLALPDSVRLVALDTVPGGGMADVRGP